MKTEVPKRVDVQLIRRIDRTAGILAIAAALTSLLTADIRLIGGVVLGAGVGWANFHGLCILVDRGVAVPEHKGAFKGALIAKFLILMTVVTVVVLVIGVEPVAFIIGFSTTVFAVMFVPLLNPLFPGKTPTDPEPKSDQLD